MESFCSYKLNHTATKNANSDHGSDTSSKNDGSARNENGPDDIRELFRQVESTLETSFWGDYSPYDDAVKLMESGNLEGGMRLMIRSARSGNDKATDWLKDNADRGDYESSVALGKMYLTGEGVLSVSYTDAERYLSVTATRTEDPDYLFCQGIIHLSDSPDDSIEKICSAVNAGSEAAIAWVDKNIEDRHIFELVARHCTVDRCGPYTRHLIMQSAQNGDTSALSALYGSSDRENSTQICDMAIQPALNGDAAAISFVRKCAQDGYAPALMTMGRLCKEGIGVEQSYYTAVNWYSKVPTFEAHTKILDIAEKIDEPNAQIMGLCYEYAILGHIRAQKCLSRYCDLSIPEAKTVQKCYEQNRAKRRKDQVKDYRKIEILAVKAAMEGDPDALSTIVKYPELRKSLPDTVIPSALKGNVNAALILLKYAESGNIQAIDCMGTLYENGIGVEQSNESAIHWYSRNRTAESVERIVAIMDEIDEPTGEIVEICFDLSFSGNEEAREHLRHYSAFDPYSMYMMGLLYIHEHEYDKALSLMRDAAESDCIEAKNWLDGDPADPNYINAWEERHARVVLLVESAFEGNDEAISILKRYPEEERTLPQEIVQSALKGNEIAISILEKFAEHGYPQATTTMGFLYEQGIYFEQSDELAIKWYSSIVTDESKLMIIDVKERKYGMNDEVMQLYYDLIESNHKGARKRIRQYCEQSKPEAIYLMARFHVKDGQYQKAVELIRKSASLGYEGAKEWLRRYSPYIGHLSRFNWNDVNW